MSRILALCLLLTLAACAVRGPIPDEGWRLVGKLSVSTTRESRILGVDWRHTKDGDEIALTGPLGLKVAQISSQGSELVVDTGSRIYHLDDAHPQRSDDLDALALPWQQLALWVRTDRIGVVAERPWRFEVTELSADGPTRMQLEHPEVSLKLKVNRWELQGVN